MGLKDLFRRKSPIEKASIDLREPYAQPDVRRQAMATLLDIGTDEAYDQLLLRFAYNANGGIADEAEKRELVGHIVDVGEEMIPPLQRYIKKEKALVFAIRALSQLMSKEQLVAFLVEALRAKEPLDHRTTEAKRALIIALGDYGNADVSPELYPYLEDHNDDVQMQAIETLERLGAEASAEALAEVCCRDTHAARIQARAAATLASMELSVRPFYERFQGEVKAEFILNKKGALIQKGAASKSA